MKVNALLMDEKDNVVTCVEEVNAGQDVVYLWGDNILTLRAEEKIPFCHKIALKTFEPGQEVFKYGELIGKTSERIEKGHWVSHKNIFSIPRDYESEYAR